MKILLPFLAILFLFATGPVEAKILVIEGSRAVKEEVSTHEPPSAYQSEAFTTLFAAFSKLKEWLVSEEVGTVGPLTIGLFLLIVPIPFSRSKVNSRVDRPGGEDSKLRRIGQSWDPRF